MAIVKFVAAKRTIKSILNYIINPEKTNETLISGVNCTPESAESEFEFTKTKSNKHGGREYYHIVQSFSPDDNITPEIAHRFLWENTGVKRVLQNEFYTGTFVCHKSYTNKINHVRKELPPEEHYRHENFVPAIISREIWEQAQFLLSEKVRNNVRASSGKPCHRYTGLLKCADCGSSFSCKTRRWKNKPDRYEYVCNGYPPLWQ